MNWLNDLLSFLAGVGLRLLIPIAVTALVIFLLRRLDARWQAGTSPDAAPAQKTICWKVKACPEATRKSCRAAKSNMPCWQVFRQQNGYLKEECLKCNVFLQAPAATD